MNVFRLLALLLCLLVCLPVYAQQNIDPAAVAVLEQTQTAYAALTSYNAVISVSAVLSTSVEDARTQARPDANADTITLAYRRPNHVLICREPSHRGEEKVLCLTDGNSLSLLYEQSPREVSKLPISTMSSKGDHFAEVEHYSRSSEGTYWLRLLLSGQKLLKQLQMAGPVRTVRVEPTRLVDGIFVHPVSIQRSFSDMESRLQFLIGVNDHLLHEVRESRENKPGIRTTIIHYDAIRVNPILPESLFTPPAKMTVLPELHFVSANFGYDFVWDKGREDGIRIGDEIAVYYKNGAVAESRGMRLLVVRLSAHSCNTEALLISGQPRSEDVAYIVKRRR